MAETLLQPLAYRVAPAGKGGDEPAARRITRYRIRLPGLMLGRVPSAEASDEHAQAVIDLNARQLAYVFFDGLKTGFVLRWVGRNTEEDLQTISSRRHEHCQHKNTTRELLLNFSNLVRPNVVQIGAQHSRVV